jgi:isopropylmalate/homocitrate/citramalate synthase
MHDIGPQLVVGGAWIARLLYGKLSAGAQVVVPETAAHGIVQEGKLHIPPESVGNERHIIMGKKTGVNYVRRRLEEMRIVASDQQAAEICRQIKELGEKKGRVSNAEFNEIVARVIPTD